MLGNHLEKYIVPTSLACPQVPAFVIIHKLVVLQYRKTTRRHILMEGYFSTSWLKTCAILADILIVTHPGLDSSVNSICMCICLLFYHFSEDLRNQLLWEPLPTLLQQGRSGDGCHFSPLAAASHADNI